MLLTLLSRLMAWMLEKLSSEELTSSKSPRLLYPTLSFPPPPPTGTGTRALCARCLTLLSHVITHYGDGTGYKSLDIPHSAFIPDFPKASRSNASVNAQDNETLESNASSDHLTCVVCTKTSSLFDVARAHISFEPSLRNTRRNEWSWSWMIDAHDPKRYPQFAFPHEEVNVDMVVTHKGGYGWVIGRFKLYPDWSTATAENAKQKTNLGVYPVIVSLDRDEGMTEGGNTGQPELDFFSTFSTGSRALVRSWAQECEKSHRKCQKIFGINGHRKTGAVWFPDRLIHITCMESTETANLGHLMIRITARIVLKSNSVDFPPDKAATGITYLSLSHCWGTPPDPSAPLGGRVGAVLTTSNLSAWQTDLPLDDLPLAFRQAIMVSASLGFEYMWIDSLCILQDNLEDWKSQSAVMGDFYKFAWLNVAALSTTSDYEGFINDSRDARVEFGFQAPFASVLGRGLEKKNSDGQECVLLRGRAKLSWGFTDGSGASIAPLFNRAWVYQERCLARRKLGFTKNCLYWTCDEHSQGEHPEWTVVGFDSSGLRRTLHSIHETAAMIEGSITGSGLALEQAWALVKRFDMLWHSCVTEYTLCKLTKHTDKLIAFSSIAQELANTHLIKKRYIAGLWDLNLPFQMAWITVKGRTTPPRKRVGNIGYVAPSWSWASIEAPVQPRFIFNSGNNTVALADVRAAEVALDTDYVFGSVKAGWLRVWGRLNRVKAAEKKAESTSLTDEATGERLWFCSDTVEGYELAESGNGIERMVWMPLTLRFDRGVVECNCLCLIQVQAEDRIGSEEGFVRAGEKVYRRLGTGNFGRIPSMLRQDKLLMGLGTYPDIQVNNEQGRELAKGFKRNEDGLEEFVLI
ncbi:hypothetical protein MMC18_006856 [Xylographa bjoerkii]|nr:hypothetical protein [Xylographa bjoerkii]